MESNQPSPGCIRIDETNIYWTTSSMGTVAKVGIGGAPDTLASGRQGPVWCAVDTKRVYWAEKATGLVLSVPIAGGSVTTVASGQENPNSPVVAGTSLVWLTATGVVTAPIPVAENILGREFLADGPNKAWVTDITYIWTREGWLYVAVIVDLSSRMVVGWAMGERIDRQLCWTHLPWPSWPAIQRQGSSITPIAAVSMRVTTIAVHWSSTRWFAA
jgi:hypothetical protein